MKYIHNYEKFFESIMLFPVSPVDPIDPQRDDVVDIHSDGIVSGCKTKDGALKIKSVFNLVFNDDILLIDMHKLEGILLDRWDGFINLLASANRINAKYRGVLEINGAKILYVAVANHESRTYYPRTNLEYSGSGCSVDQRGADYPMLCVLLVSDLPKICDGHEMEHIIQSGVILHNYNDTIRADSRGNLISNSAILYTDSTHNQCDVCRGTGAKTCELCKGRGGFKCGKCSRGFIKCETCDGDDKLEGGTECFECENGNVECEFCHGSGSIDCEKCHGSGSIACEKCHGTGAIDVNKILPLKN